MIWNKTTPSALATLLRDCVNEVNGCLKGAFLNLGSGLVICMYMHVYINYSLVLIFLHGKKVYWGREKKMRNIYREKDRKRRKKRKKKQGPACSAEDQWERELVSLVLVTTKKHSKQSRRIAGTPKLSTMPKGEG